MKRVLIVYRLGDYFVKWFTGGLAYFYLEILFRGYSHYTMFILGGLCFLLVGEFGTRMLKKNISNVYKIIFIMLCGTLIITFAELITGIIVNVVFDMQVWDYSDRKYNYMGQICPEFSAMWALVSLVCVYADALLRMFLLGGGEETE